MSNLTPDNDSCERTLALATTFNGSITNDEESYQELVLVVEDHCRKFIELPAESGCIMLKTPVFVFLPYKIGRGRKIG